ncbi:MAG: hypothetical protein LRZ85_00590 [Alphaproteobacteria bacterium]|nr:hypothetical protein [Alphaproteobacteria bacterium]MCD8519902.1 hypothetical protein [Alphaproteobacteria bacterium]MCD8570882.1 hypothetical protein [Alphaproteobacteria bacterium]
MKKLACLLSLLLICACGPIYDTQYRYETPPTAEGKICASSCIDKLNTCSANCKTEEANCRHIKSLEAKNAYLEYVNERQRKGEKVKKSQSDFEYYGSCSNSCQDDCENVHRICHSTCGGNVVEHRTCTAFCNQQ